MSRSRRSDSLHKATLELDADEPQLIIDALRPDISPSQKFTASLNPAAGKLILTVRSAELAGLAAGLASYLRLIRAATEASELK